MKVELFQLPGYEHSEAARTGRCGPGRGVLERIIPDKILFLSITEACKRHDFAYALGITHAEKAAADRSFKYNMQRIIEAKGGFLMAPRLTLSQVYYLAVKHLGGPAFWHGKNDPAEMGEAVI